MTLHKQQEEIEKVEIKEIYTQKYCGKDYLAEGIIIGTTSYFAVSSKPKPKDNDVEDNNFPIIVLVEMLPIDATTAMKPPELNSYLNKPYVFKSEEEFYQYVERAKQTDIYTLFKDVKSIWKKYSDADDFHISICAADTIFTHFQDRIGLTHYLFFVGSNSSGKSNNLIIFHYLGYRNMMSTDVTAANIYQFLNNFDEGQGTICEDEADNIDKNTDKMRIYKNGYTTGFPVYRTDLTYGRKQYRYFTFCFKAFAAERTPDSLKGKGFNQRIIELHCSPGFPQYDISEVVNPAGEDKYQQLLDELLNTRKLLLAYRLLHFHDKIPDIKLNIENREKQLFKPIVRIFQNSKEMLDLLLPVISRYVSQKRESNTDSLNCQIYRLIKQMIRDKNSTQIESSEIWNNVIKELNGELIKAQTIQTPEFGPISQKEIIQILKDVFKAKPPKRHGKIRSLVFDIHILSKLGKLYELDVNVKVEQLNQMENGTDGTHAGYDVGLDKHLFDEGNGTDGTHGTHGTLSGDTQDNSDTITTSSEDLENDDYSNNTYSYNASQASQFQKSSTKTDNELITENNNASQASQTDSNAGPISYKCNYCCYDNEFSRMQEYLVHHLLSHNGKPPQPNKIQIQTMKEAGEQIEFKGNIWES